MRSIQNIPQEEHAWTDLLSILIVKIRVLFNATFINTIQSGLHFICM